MTIILTTTEGLQTYTDVYSIFDAMEKDTSYYFFESFNPKVGEFMIDKNKVLLIQVTK